MNEMCSLFMLSLEHARVIVFSMRMAYLMTFPEYT